MKKSTDFDRISDDCVLDMENKVIMWKGMEFNFQGFLLKEVTFSACPKWMSSGEIRVTFRAGSRVSDVIDDMEVLNAR